jgi:hypothetical protein
LRGIWVIDLEPSQFFPNVSTLKKANGEPKWLESNLLHSRGQILDAARGAGRRVYGVDFEGRHSLCDSDFGHMGMPPRVVIANRFYSMRLLPSRPS